MKVNREQAAQNRERILDTASRLFRERGFDGIGVADLMKSAGLTHGGFYGHFSSKEDLMAQACTRAFTQSIGYLNETIGGASKKPLTDVTKGYLSRKHRDQPGKGCVIAALGPDVSRQGAQVKKTFTQGVKALVELIATLMPEKSKIAKREKALAIYASFVGALVLARAVDDADLSEDILKSVSTFVLESA